MSRINDFGILFYFHSFLILLVYISPFFIPWQLLIPVVIYLYAQELILGQCIISKIQFGLHSHTTFFYHYLRKLHLKANIEVVDMFLVWILPLCVLAFAYVLQEIIHFIPLLF
ncbi:hypothetical protein HZA98_03150 [Candidatus Woesearchaeota archaeon]|nr:hypothetical protein [Candidatus Woesearchaeota archaeon]